MTCERSKKFFKNTEYKGNAQITYKRILSEKQIEQLKLHEFDWREILALEDTSKAYGDFLNIFSKYYNDSFS